MKKIFLPLFFALLILALALVGPETPADDPAQTPEAPQNEESEAPPADEPEGGETLETFVPSEKLPADSAIAFPVDI